MKVKLSQDFFVEIDDLNYTLKQTKAIKDKNGNAKSYEKIYGYYGSFEQAVEKFLRVSNNCVTDVEKLEIREYVKCIVESNKMAVKTFKEIMEGSVK